MANTYSEYDMISIPGPKKVLMEFFRKFGQWKDALWEKDPKRPQGSSIDDSLHFFEKESRSFLNAWISWLEEENVAHQEGRTFVPSPFIRDMMRFHKPRWLETVFEIEKIVKWLPENKKESAYELIFTFLIDFHKAQILSEEDLWEFLNRKTHGRLITNYAVQKYTHFDTSTETASVNLNTKQSLETSRSVDGFPHLLHHK
jgi:hypothetical protein